VNLSISHIGKSFGGVRALDEVSFDIGSGEIHAVMGENGAGKSTLIKIITGVHRPDSGQIAVDGRSVEFGSPRESLAAGIGVVHQERNLIPRFTVGENIMLERLPRRGPFVDYDAVHARARAALDQLESAIDTRTEVSTLSVAQMQIVEIAKALSIEARMLLLDEPTASITDHEAASLFEVMRRLRDRGAAIVFVSHKLEEVLALCDRVTVLRDGKVVASGIPIAEVSRDRLVSMMIGRSERTAAIGRRELGADEPALQLREISTSFGHRDVSFSLRKGEILGLYGLVGAGRTELARAILGLGQITAGEIRVSGQTVRIRSLHEALEKYRLGYVSEDRKQEGLILAHSVRDNIALAVWPRIAGPLGLITPAAEDRAAAPYVKRLQLRVASLDQLVSELSGGNQQKVSIAKWLAAKTDILIVDEPTVGIDVKTKTEIHELIAEIAGGGLAVLLISSDMSEMITLADRILVLHDFRLAGEIVNDHRYETTSAAIMSAIHAVENAAARP
jgi:ribose transport system ATP-binding protein